jgi:hypothetical protein
MKVFAVGGEQIRFQKMTGRYWMVQIGWFNPYSNCHEALSSRKNSTLGSTQQNCKKSNLVAGSIRKKQHVTKSNIKSHHITPSQRPLVPSKVKQSGVTLLRWRSDPIDAL